MATPIRLPIRGADTAGDAVRQTIRAFHGSPHDFDRFDASKIGTGEGAQAYGHGLYFAENENVAESYREQLTPSGLLPHTPTEKAELLWRYNHGRPDVKQRVLQTLIDDQSAFGVDNRAAIEYVRSLPSDFVPPRPSPPPRLGHVYEVEIAYPEQAMLDWDAPISRQPKVVQKVFGDFAMDEPGDGGRIYRDIATRHGESFDDDMTGVLANLEASKELLAEGIPGIRYLDQSSRRAGKGTSNYVMFPGTEDQIRVLRKYGLLAPMAAAGTMGEE